MKENKIKNLMRSIMPLSLAKFYKKMEAVEEL